MTTLLRSVHLVTTSQSSSTNTSQKVNTTFSNIFHHVLQSCLHAVGPPEAPGNKGQVQAKRLGLKHILDRAVLAAKPSSTASKSGLQQKVSLADVASQKMLVDRVAQRLSSALKVIQHTYSHCNP